MVLNLGYLFGCYFFRFWKSTAPQIVSILDSQPFEMKQKWNATTDDWRDSHNSDDRNSSYRIHPDRVHLMYCHGSHTAIVYIIMPSSLPICSSLHTHIDNHLRISLAVFSFPLSISFFQSLTFSYPVSRSS